MECKESKIKDVSVLEIIGRLDATNSSTLEEQITESINNGNHQFVADLSQLDYISSAGLRVFLAIAKKLSNIGQIHLCCLQTQVKEVFEMSGFTTIFKLYDTQDEAVNA
jgi:anti-sigma B factor antagonist